MEFRWRHRLVDNLHRFTGRLFSGGHSNNIVHTVDVYINGPHYTPDCRPRENLEKRVTDQDLIILWVYNTSENNSALASDRNKSCAIFTELIQY